MNAIVKRSIKFLGIVALGAGIVVGGVSLGRKSDDHSLNSTALAHPVPYYNDGEIPAYPGGLEYSLGDDLHVNNVRVRISYFYTDDNLEKVRDFYIKHFKKQGLKPEVSVTSPTELNVYALNRDRSGQFSITVVQDGNQTVVFPAIIPLSGKILSSSAAKRNDMIPFSPDAVGIMDVSSDREMGAFMTYIEPKFDLLSALGHIRDTMGRKGWNLEEYKPNQDGKGKSAYIQLSKGTSHMAFNVVNAQGGQNGVTVTVNTIEAKD